VYINVVSYIQELLTGTARFGSLDALVEDTSSASSKGRVQSDDSLREMSSPFITYDGRPELARTAPPEYRRIIGRRTQVGESQDTVEL
jgi:hypothetical protein